MTKTGNWFAAAGFKKMLAEMKCCKYSTNQKCSALKAPLQKFLYFWKILPVCRYFLGDEIMFPKLNLAPPVPCGGNVLCSSRVSRVKFLR